MYPRAYRSLGKEAPWPGRSESSALQAVCDSLYDEFRRPDFAAPPLLKRLVEAGHYGRKSGRGFYDYGR